VIVQVDIWFKPTPASATENTEEEDEDEDEHQQPQQQAHQQAGAAVSLMIDRLTCLHPVLFDLFADLSIDPPMLNYLEMVMSRWLRLSQ